MKDLRAVEAVIIRANRVLLLQRKSGTWQFVTGGAEEGETIEAALKREIKEETGMTDTRVVRKLGDRRITVTGKQVKIESFLVMANTVTVDVEHNPDGEHIDYKWVWLTDAAKDLHYDD